MTQEHAYGTSLHPITLNALGPNDSFHLHNAWSVYVQGQLNDAERLCRGVLEKYPQLPAARHLLGLIVFSTGKIPLAVEQMQLAVAGLEAPPPLYLLNLGLVLNAAGQWEQAIQALQRACAMDPEQIDFNTKLAAVLLNAGHLEEAAIIIQRSLQIHPMDMQALETARMIKAKQIGRNLSVLPAAGDQQETAPARCANASDYSVTISARNRLGPVSQLLREHFGSIPLNNIDSLFGFTQRCRLYGGRQFFRPEIENDDLEWMYAQGINYRIPLTNKLVTPEDYEIEKPFLAMHHRKGNSVIVVKDDLARWIRRDFPLYKIEASVIRETDSADKLQKTLEIFDTVVPLPEAFNTNYQLLESFPQEIKDRIRLFLNTGCAYHCPRRICYLSFSRINRQEPGAKFECSQNRLSYHFTQGMTDFPMRRFMEMGYRKFKLLRAKNSLVSTAN